MLHHKIANATTSGGNGSQRCLLFYLLFAVSFRLSIQLATAQSNSALTYTFTTFAGKATRGSSDGIGGAARFDKPSGCVVDQTGNVYVVDTWNFTVRRVTPAGEVSTIAGYARSRGSADGVGTSARFAGGDITGPSGITMDTMGNLYLADTYNETIRKLTPSGTNWIVSTIAGLPKHPDSINGTNSDARFRLPLAVSADIFGNLFVADWADNTIRKLTPIGTNWSVTTIAGLSLTPGDSDGKNSGARFSYPEGLAADAVGNIYVADTGNGTIRKISIEGTNWVVSTIAGRAGVGGNSDGIGTNATFSSPSGITIDKTGAIFVLDRSNIIRKMTPDGTNWVVSTLAGFAGNSGNTDGTGTNAHFNVNTSIATYYTCGIGVDGAGTIYIVDTGNDRIRKASAVGVVNPLAGQLEGGVGSGDGTGEAARFNQPKGVAVSAEGTVYVADTQNHTIRTITSAGVAGTLAGSASFPGLQDGIGSYAHFDGPTGIAVSRSGDVYIADHGNAAIRRITAAGLVTTIAGSRIGGSADGEGHVARFSAPFGIVVDNARNVYVTDRFNHTIRKLTPVDGDWVVSTIAGKAMNTGNTDGVGDAARFNQPSGIALDGTGNLFVADYFNSSVRKLTPLGTNWIVSTIAVAEFFQAYGVAVDTFGTIYVADTIKHLIRTVTTSGLVTTIGGLQPYYSGAVDGIGNAALFHSPFGVTLDGDGVIFIADTENNTIRKGVFTAYKGASPVIYTPPANNGSLTVTLVPPEANGQWRFPWELSWHNSGETISNLAAGRSPVPANYSIEFRNVPGWVAIPIPSESVQLLEGKATSITNEYFPTISTSDTNSTPGSLTVFLGPIPPREAGWRFIGDDTAFFANGFTTNLLPGTYLIEFAAVNDRIKPSSQSVEVNPGAPTFISVNYLLADTPPANVYLPFLVPTNQVNDETIYPFGFNGQLQSDIGYGSGVAVQTNVVLTAAHLVFNDQTLSYVTRAHWFFRREARVSEPLPQEARSYYLLSSYAAQRTNDLFSGYSPDQSTPRSRNLDVAALYFQDAVAGRGHGGYLPSDAVPNTWLTSTALKMLVGYPVDGSQFGDASITTNAGKMYQTDPQPFPFALANDSVPGQQQVYEAPWFLSYPGNSGGPLYVQLNGYYYPAAVYLGTRFSGSQPVSSLVRAIDSNVVNLITLAAEQGESGTNNTGGGVIRIIPSQNISAKRPGYVRVHLSPPEAVVAGAGWRLQGDTSFSSASNYTRAVKSTNSFAIECKPIPGWHLPTSQSMSVTAGFLTTTTATYTVITSNLWTNAMSGKWESTNNWSDDLPFATEFIYFTNATTKTVALDNLTASTSSITMTVSNLTVSAPPGATNTLFLTGTGPVTPLRIKDRFELLTGGALHLSQLAVLAANRAVDSGDLNIDGGTMIVSNSLSIGDCANGKAGAVRLSSGSLIVSNQTRTAVVIVSDGTFRMTGGTLVADKLIVTNVCGRFMRSGGTVLATTYILTPDLDADGDGFSNAEESVLGTDPLDAAASPVRPALSITRSNGIVQISWAATSIFRLQESTNLNPALWSNSTNTFTTIGSIKTFSVSTSAARKFYRLIAP